MKCAELAYIKALLHAFKHPSEAVCGLLLGKLEGNELFVTDCIPLFHMNSTLLPMLDVAFLQAQAYCEGNDIQIVGYYAANEGLDDDKVSEHSCQVASRVKDGFKNAVHWQLINKKLTPKTDSLAITVCTSAGKDKPWAAATDAAVSRVDFVQGSGGGTLTPEAVFAGVRAAIKGFVFKAVADFDDHLEDMGQDIFNAGLDAKIAAAVGGAETQQAGSKKSN